MVPEAPPMFSMMMVWPRSCCARCMTMRAIVSVGPPADAGTIAVTERVGYDCALAAEMPAAVITSAATTSSLIWDASVDFAGRLARRRSGLEARVEIVAQGIAEQVEGEHGQADRGAGEQDHPRCLAIEVRRIAGEHQ